MEAVSLTNEDAKRSVSRLQETVASLPARTELETTWDHLQVLHSAYTDWQIASREQADYERAASELEVAHREFLAARDDVLSDIYGDVNERFGEFYRAIDPGTGTKRPKLEQTSTGIDFSVDFYDTGEHPPNALHSEGQQDMMGICMFLALAESFAPIQPMPILLDDVVMAVDAERQANFADLLASELDDQFQCIVTTREEQWANQLQIAGAVDRSV